MLSIWQLAGILDSTGSINLRSTTPIISLTRKTPELPEALYRDFGGSLGRAENEFRWRLSGLRAVKLLRQVRPLLLNKWLEADLVMQFYEQSEIFGATPSERLLAFREETARLLAKAKKDPRPGRFFYESLTLEQLAGIFDCQGSFRLIYGHYPYLRLQSKGWGIPRKLYHQLGGRLLRLEEGSPRPRSLTSGRRSWAWRLFGVPVIELLRKVRPFLIARKVKVGEFISEYEAGPEERLYPSRQEPADLETLRAEVLKGLYI